MCQTRTVFIVALSYIVLPRRSPSRSQRVGAPGKQPSAPACRRGACSAGRSVSRLPQAAFTPSLLIQLPAQCPIGWASRLHSQTTCGCDLLGLIPRHVPQCLRCSGQSCGSDAHVHLPSAAAEGHASHPRNTQGHSAVRHQSHACQHRARVAQVCVLLLEFEVWCRLLPPRSHEHHLDKVRHRGLSAGAAEWAPAQDSILPASARSRVCAAVLLRPDLCCRPCTWRAPPLHAGTSGLGTARTERWYEAS